MVTAKNHGTLRKLVRVVTIVGMALLGSACNVNSSEGPDALDGGFTDGDVTDASDGGFTDGDMTDASDGGFTDGDMTDASDGGFTDGDMTDASDGSFTDGEMTDASDGDLDGGVPTVQYDVVVYGATEGGIAAASVMGHRGLSVALVDELDYLGGQIAAGVPNMDGHAYVWAHTGFYWEFVQDIRAVYEAAGKSMDTCYTYFWGSNHICFEPHVALPIFQNYLQDAGVDLYLDEAVTEVLSSGKQVQGIRTARRTYLAKVVLDASEYGDVIRLSPARYRVGLHDSGDLDLDSCVQDVTYTAIIRRYDTLPSQLRITAPPPGGPANTYADNKPYFASHVQVISPNPTSITGMQNLFTHNAYRGLPSYDVPGSYDSSDPALILKTSINWFNDYPYTVRAVVDPAERHRLNCQAKLKTLQFIYYIQTELAAEGGDHWSVAREENYNTAYNTGANLCDEIPAELKPLEQHMPPEPYMRESVRIVGLETFNTAHVLATAQTQVHPESLGYSQHPEDFHRCYGTDDGTIDGIYNEGDIEQNVPFRDFFMEYSSPIPLPFGIFIPETVDGLLPANGKLLSTSRFGNSQARLQPVAFIVGQAAGTIAALAVEQDVQARDVDYRQVQEDLLDQGAVIVPYWDIMSIPLHSAYKAINIVALRGAMGAAETRQIDDTSWQVFFRPNDSTTRRAAAVATVRMAKLTGSIPATATFEDVPLGAEGRPEIEILFAEGITSGCSSNPLRFCRDDDISRASTAAFLVRAKKILDPSLDLTPPPTATFGDVPDTHPLYREVEAAYRLGILGPCSTNPMNFCPDAPVSRAEMAQALVAGF